MRPMHVRAQPSDTRTANMRRMRGSAEYANSSAAPLPFHPLQRQHGQQPFHVDRAPFATRMHTRAPSYYGEPPTDVDEGQGSGTQHAQHTSDVGAGVGVQDGRLNAQNSAYVQMSRQMSQMAGSVATCVQQNEMVITLLQRLVTATERMAERSSAGMEAVQPAAHHEGHQQQRASPRESLPLVVVPHSEADDNDAAYDRSAPSPSPDPIVLSDDVVAHPAEVDEGQQHVTSVQQQPATTNDVDEQSPHPTYSPKVSKNAGEADEIGRWQSWLRPRRAATPVLRALAKPQYWTIKQVRTERSVKTKRPLSAIGRIPLREYLEVGSSADYRAVRHLARRLYSDWLAPRVRIAKQDGDRLLACFHRIEHAYPILAECESHWKARELILQVIDNAIDDHRHKAKTGEEGDDTLADISIASRPQGRKRGRPKGTTNAAMALRRQREVVAAAAAQSKRRRLEVYDEGEVDGEGGAGETMASAAKQPNENGKTKCSSDPLHSHPSQSDQQADYEALVQGGAIPQHHQQQQQAPFAIAQRQFVRRGAHPSLAAWR